MIEHPRAFADPVMGGLPTIGHSHSRAAQHAQCFYMQGHPPQLRMEGLLAGFAQLSAPLSPGAWRGHERSLLQLGPRLMATAQDSRGHTHASTCTSSGSSSGWQCVVPTASAQVQGVPRFEDSAMHVAVQRVLQPLVGCMRCAVWWQSERWKPTHGTGCSSALHGTCAHVG